NLKDAIALAQDGDVIEIRGDGPFVTESLRISGKALTIRSGKGFTPVIQLSAAAISKGEVLLETDAPLTLEGLEFQRRGIDEASITGGGKLILSRKAPVHLGHCRFLVKGSHAYVVWASGTPRFDVRQCFFACSFDADSMVHSLYWGERPPGGRMTVENCLLA